MPGRCLRSASTCRKTGNPGDARIRSELRACSSSLHEIHKDSFAQAIPLLRLSGGIAFYCCPLALDAPVVCRPLLLEPPIVIGLVWLKKRRNPQLAQLVGIIAGLPKGFWRNGDSHSTETPFGKDRVSR